MKTKTVSVWRVTAEVPRAAPDLKQSWRSGASQKLIMATHDRAAVNLHLRLQHGFDSRLETLATELWEDGRAEAVPVCAVRLRNGTAGLQHGSNIRSPGQTVFVASDAEAVTRAEEAYGFNVGWYEPADPIDAFWALHQPDLFILARSVWKGGWNEKKAPLHLRGLL
ncbi:MAG: hypothetical protein OXC11_16135, partial [Rhodospirillales bacterium]|nr:hypothetical protein [Rhodospirillales bacterium]